MGLLLFLVRPRVCVCVCVSVFRCVFMCVVRGSTRQQGWHCSFLAIPLIQAWSTMLELRVLHLKRKHTHIETQALDTHADTSITRLYTSVYILQDSVLTPRLCLTIPNSLCYYFITLFFVMPSPHLSPLKRPSHLNPL